MKKVFVMIALASACLSASAQIEKKEIIIQKNGNDQKTITVQVDGDNVLINGMTPDEFRNEMGRDNVIIRGDKSDKNTDDENMNVEESVDSLTFLGVSTKQNEKGAEVISVSPESAAAKAGLLENDIITKLGNDKITSPVDLSDAVKSHKPDEKVKITFIRNGKEKSCNAILQLKKEVRKKVIVMRKTDGFDLPGDFDLSGIDFNFSGKPKMGIKIQDTEDENGVKVIDVNEDSPAAKAGVQKNDIIVSINDNQINTTDEAREQLSELENNSTYDLKVRRNGNEMNIKVTFPKKLKTADL